MSSSTTPAPKFEWLVVVPDRPGTIAKRLEVRSTHFSEMSGVRENGIYKMGGAVLDEQPTSDNPADLKFAGSTLIINASTKDEVLDYLKKDIYTRSGVWDTDKAQIWALKTAFRNP